MMMLALLSASCQRQQGRQGQARIPAVPVVQVPGRDIIGERSYPVSLQGIVNAEVRARIAGYITGVLVDEGEHVRAGQPLFRLETQSLTEDAQAAKANIDAAQVGVDQLRPLVRQNIVSQVQLETAEARLAQAKAAYNSITASIGYANIASPVEGFVGAIPYRQGTLVGPTTPLPLTTVSNTSEVYGYFSMNEADYVDFLQKTPGATLEEKVKHFPPVKLQLPNGEVYAHAGRIMAVTAQVDPATGSVSFRATFPNPEHLIPNGSSGIILVPVDYKDAVLVPQESTYEQQGKVYVFQVVGDTAVTARVIDVRDQVDNLYVVRSGIRTGDLIVAKGAAQLREGARIQPQPMVFDSLATSIKPVFQ